MRRSGPTHGGGAVGAEANWLHVGAAYSAYQAKQTVGSPSQAQESLVRLAAADDSTVRG